MRLRDLVRPSKAQTPTSADGRPVLAIGHVTLDANDIDLLADFYAAIGCRRVVRLPGVAILELRGGTHLAISKGAPGGGSLDLMVDDLDAAWGLLDSREAAPDRIGRRGPHRVFTAADPEGNVLVVHDSHVVGIV